MGGSRNNSHQFGSLGKRVYDYDSEGRPRAVLVYKNGLILSTIQYGYDDWDRLSEQLELAGQGQTARGRLATERLTNRLDASLDAISTYI